MKQDMQAQSIFLDFIIRLIVLLLLSLSDSNKDDNSQD